MSLGANLSLSQFPHPLNGDGVILITQQIYGGILSTAQYWEYKDKQLENKGAAWYTREGDLYKSHSKASVQ